MNRNRWLTSHTSPRHDPVLTAIQIGVLVLALVAMALIVGRLTAAPPPVCPAPDHPVWASTLQQWLCGDSLTAGVKAR